MPQILFLMKLQPLGNFIKKETDTGVFLWILQKFQEHFFGRTPPGDCIIRKHYSKALLEKF